MQNKIVGIIGIGILVTAAFMIISAGMDKSERAECETWKAQSIEYKGFYLTSWQKEQCDTHGIHIEAPVR